MRKNRTRILFIILILIMVACSKKEENTLHKDFDSFIQLWSNSEFTKMYDLITDTSKSEYPPEQFIDRYQKIYEDLNISNLNISYNQLSEEELELVAQEGIATLPFSVSMDSIAGTINFDYEVTLIQEGEEGEDKKWVIDWNPGFIFPALKDGGEIRLQTNNPIRGEILDRNRMPLAINDYVYEVGIVPEKLEDNPDQQKEQIASLLKVSVDFIESKLNANWVKPDLFVPLKKLPKTDQNTVDQLLQNSSVMIREVMGRVYPLNEAAAHLVGYIGPITAEELEEKEPGQYSSSDYIGKRGLEQLFEETLKGERGISIIVVKDDGEEELIAEQPVKNGETITLTIDVNIQEKIFESYENEAGSAVAIHPKTGETLALVSSPSFDPNEFLYGITQNRLNELENDPKKPIINRFTATFAPGSVIKPIVGAIGLNNKIIDPDEGIEIKGLTWDNDGAWKDYQVRRVSQTNEPVDLLDALIRSDNIYFAMKAVDMGIKEFTDGLKQYGFSEKIPFNYPIRNSTISSTGEIANEVELANTSYGQAEVEMSALHLAVAYTSFLNDGNMIKPTLLSSEDTGEVWKEGLISPEESELIQQALRDVVTKGTGRIAQTDELAISGKTGTAELKLSLDEKGHENGWFVGYPTDNQDILIAMLVEHVEDKGTSTFVAEKVKNILVEFSQK